MGCNCKNVKNIENIYNHLNNNDINKNIRGYQFIKQLEKKINQIFIILLTIILIPLIVIDIILNGIFTFKIQSLIIKLVIKRIKRNESK